jgi:uncharacterized SAM-binding protein YcdF (DUF218 family)
MDPAVNCSPAEKTDAARLTLKRAAGGFILGTLGWIAARELRLNGGIPYLSDTQYDILIMGVLGAVIGLTRLRGALWVGNGILCAAYFVIGYTPLIDAPVRALVERDPPHPCPAVVVLSADLFADGGLDRHAYDRVMRGIQLVRQGYAERLVLTRLPLRRKSSVPAVKRELAALGFAIPIDEVGPVQNTYDEAVAVRALARSRGWKELLLVTSPTHTKRARATFLKAGLSVLVQPCEEHMFDLNDLHGPGDRLAAFREWLYETAGWQMYRLRGRL